MSASAAAIVVRTSDLCPACRAGVRRADRTGQSFRVCEVCAALPSISVDQAEVRIALYEHMAYLSQEHWCAGWLDRLGETLQGIIDRDNHHPAGYVAFPAEEFETLKRLRAEAGGWWVWDDAVEDGPEGDCVRFVPDAAQPPAGTGREQG